MKRAALCVGINDYPGTQNDLSGCVNDANDWASYLDELKFDQIYPLRDSEATKSKILSSIESILSNLRSGDLFFMTNSSHGSYIPDRDSDELDKRDECLCPYDIDSGNYIVDDELHSLFLPAKVNGIQVVVFSDSCHSGSVLRLFEIPNEATQSLRVRFLPPNTFYREQNLDKPHLQLLSLAKPTSKILSKVNVGTLLAGCQDSEYSYDAEFDGRPNGAFTYFGIKSLKEMSVCGLENFTYRDWYKRIRSYLPSQSYPQRPNLEGSKTMTSKAVFGGVSFSTTKEIGMTKFPAAAKGFFGSYADFLMWLKSLGANAPQALMILQKLSNDVEKATPEVKAIVQDFKDLAALLQPKVLEHAKRAKEISGSPSEEEIALEKEIVRVCEKHMTKGLPKGPLVDILRSAWQFLKDNPELLTFLLSLIMPHQQQ